MLIKLLNRIKNKLKCIIDGNTIFNTPTFIANGFNEYLMEVGQNLSSNTSIANGSIYIYLNNNNNNNSMHLRNSTEQEAL